MHLETFFADAWNALRQLTRDQNERFRAIRNPLDAVDYLSFGAISANRQRYGEMLEDPSFHTVGNWLTLGLFDTVKGALDPEEPMSFQHVMDLAGLLGVVTSVYKAGSRVAGMSDPEDVLRRTQQGNQGARVADDAVDLGRIAEEIEIIDGKVGGKIPIDDYISIRKSSVKNPDKRMITLGKYTDDASSYIAKAGTDSSYFDLGDEWRIIKERFNLSDREMFDYFNTPVLDDAIRNGKTIRFSHNPLDFPDSFLEQEWEYIKSSFGYSDENLIFQEGFWNVK